VIGERQKPLRRGRDAHRYGPVHGRAPHAGSRE
jgi:hypothetical protein